MVSAAIKFIRQEVEDLLAYIAEEEYKLGRKFTKQEQNELLLCFVAEHGNELERHAEEILSEEEREELHIIPHRTDQ